jgi:hypothetical protein
MALREGRSLTFNRTHLPSGSFPVPEADSKSVSETGRMLMTILLKQFGTSDVPPAGAVV